jgi:hypothetical protein
MQDKEKVTTDQGDEVEVYTGPPEDVPRSKDDAQDDLEDDDA